MILLILIFAALSLLAGIVIIIDPEIIFGHLRKNLDQLSLQFTAVAARLVIGILLLSQAEASKFPLTVEILGWLSLVAAMTFAVMGRGHFIRLMSWALSLLKPLGRVGGIFAAAFGAFLIYAFI